MFDILNMLTPNEIIPECDSNIVSSSHSISDCNTTAQKSSHDQEHAYPPFTIPQLVPQRIPTDSMSVQALIDENAELLKSALEYQRLGRIVEAASYQCRLHSNLVVLANLADRLMKSKRFKTSLYSAYTPFSGNSGSVFNAVDTTRNMLQRHTVTRHTKDTNLKCKRTVVEQISKTVKTQPSMSVYEGHNISDSNNNDYQKSKLFENIDCIDMPRIAFSASIEECDVQNK